MARFFLVSLFCLINIYLTIINCQPTPEEFFLKKSRKILYDIGEDWYALSFFNPIRYQDIKDEKLKKSNPKKGYVRLKTGIRNRKNDISLYTFGHFRYKENYYAYIYPRAIINSSFFEPYAGNKIENFKLSYNSGEVDMSGIGYQNNWFRMKLCRGRENWGAGNDIELALSANSNPYDYFQFGSDYGRLRVNYIHGFLETIGNVNNRYITARGIEWTNNSSLLIGLSETVIYSGARRPLDFGYFNPISSHLEIELNNRLNFIGNQYSNAVWQAHIDLMVKNNIRLSVNFLIDEFVIDPNIEKNKENGTAGSYRIAYTMINTSGHILLINSTYVKVGTPTFRHSNGYNNFVNQNTPLGWNKGSDATELQIGFTYFNRKNIISSISFNTFNIGEENILTRPYDPYYDYYIGAFPSGKIMKRVGIESSIEWWWRPNVSFLILSNLESDDTDKIKFNFLFSVDASIEKLISI